MKHFLIGLIGFILLIPSTPTAFAQTILPPTDIIIGNDADLLFDTKIPAVETWQFPIDYKNPDILQQALVNNTTTRNQTNTNIVSQLNKVANLTVNNAINLRSLTNNPARVLQGNTQFSITNPSSTRTITIPDVSGEISLLGQTITGSEIVDNTIDLATKTTGNFVKDITAGNGLTITNSNGKGAIPDVALGDLTTDWIQNNAHDIILNNKDSGIKLLGSDGSNYITIDAGSLSQDATITLSGTSGNLLTSSNYTSYITNSGIQAANNLSDLTDISSARTNLGLGTIATQSASSITVGTGTFTSLLGTTINGLTITNNGNNTLNVAAGKTVTFAKSLTLDGTDGTTHTFPSSSDTIAGIASTQTLTNKTITASSNTISGLSATNFSTANISQWTNNSGFITSSTTDTLTNKTLTSPIISTISNTGTLTLPSSTDTLIGKATTDILTNKTLVATSNTISGLSATNFSTANISQWTNNSGFITSSTTDTLTNKTLTSPAINGTVTTTGLTLPSFTASGNITGSGTPTLSSFGAINGITLATSSDGLTLSGGTTPRTLTLTSGDITLGSTIKPTSSGSLTIQSNGANTLTLDTGGSAGITLGTNASNISLEANATVSANKTLSVTTADKLLVGGNIIPQVIPITVPLTSTILTAPVFISDSTYQVTAAKCIPSALSISGTFQVTVDSGTTSAGGGTSQLSSTISLSGTVNTVVSGTLIASPTTINAGDRVTAKFGGLLTSLAGNCTIYLKRV